MEPNPESIRMRGMGNFAKQCGEGKRMGKLIGVRGKSFLSKDITKFVTEDLVSSTPNIYLMQAFMGPYVATFKVYLIRTSNKLKYTSWTWKRRLILCGYFVSY